MNRGEFEIKVVALDSKIFRFAKSLLLSDSEAEDVVQDIYEKMWAIRDRLDRYENVEAFVFTSVKNLCYDRLRHRAMRRKSVSDIGKESYNVAVEHNQAEHSDTYRLVMQAIAELPVKQRLVIHMRDVEGLEFAEIAEISDSDVETVRVNLSRARKNVKEKMLKVMNHGL